MAQWEISDGKFKGFTFNVARPKQDTNVGAQSQEIKNERRLQISERAGIDGGDVEDFGRKPFQLSATVIFFGGDYADDLKTFLAILNEGTTGVLILPDHPDAVMAKFAGCSRRTDTDSVTTLQINWVEDHSVDPTQSSGNLSSPGSPSSDLNAAQGALQGGNPAAALPTIQSVCASVKAYAASAEAALNNNALISGIKSVQAAVVNITSAGNAVLIIGFDTRQNLISLSKSLGTTLSGVQGLMSGLQNYLSDLTASLTQPNPMRYVAAAGSVDFANVDAPVTATVNGNAQVVQASAPQTTSVQSFGDAQTQVQTLLSTARSSRQALEQAASQGSLPVDDISSAAVQMEAAIQDLVYLLTPAPKKQVTTRVTTSLIEVCFDNGLYTDQIDRIYQQNTHLDDILVIPPGTVITL